MIASKDCWKFGLLEVWIAGSLDCWKFGLLEVLHVRSLPPQADASVGLDLRTECLSNQGLSTQMISHDIGLSPVLDVSQNACQTRV
jgi:hypothetical protein